MRVLVAYDGSPASEAAISEVLRRPWPAGTRIRIATVTERPLSSQPPNGLEFYAPLVERVRSSLREEAYHRVQKLLGRFAARPDLDASYELREGNPKQALLEMIEEWRADLVLAGSHGKGDLARLFLGSVSHALVTSAPCNVEIIKTKNEQ